MLYKHEVMQYEVGQLTWIAHENIRLYFGTVSEESCDCNDSVHHKCSKNRRPGDKIYSFLCRIA